jgi:hypothetical protein
MKTILSLLCIGCLLCGCGQSGKLYLPPPVDTSKPVPAAVTPAPVTPTKTIAPEVTTNAS